MNVATARRLRRFGDEYAEAKAPANLAGYKYVAHSPGLMSASFDSIDAALEAGWALQRRTESPVLIWDYRGNGADYDPAAEPEVIGVVAVIWLDSL